MERKKFTEEEVKEIISLYKRGKTAKEIGYMFNSYNTSIRRVLLRNNVKLRGVSKVLRFCKHNPFKRNDELSEYFMGLIATDGSMSKGRPNRTKELNLSLSETDGYIVEAFRDWASPNAKVSKVLQHINNSYMYSITIANNEIAEWLERKINFIRKSYDCKFYTPITWNILRGIFDGDGGFHKDHTRLSFFICAKSFVFANQLKMFIGKYGIKTYVRKRKSSNDSYLYYVEVYKSADVMKIGELMYNNAHIFIKRKYERWLAFYESRRANGVNSGNEMAIQS